jgi:hypothetical protein
VISASDDSSVVAIMLRPSTTYRCILPAAGNALYVDVSPAGDRASTTPVRQEGFRPAGAKPAVTKPRLAAAVKAPVRDARKDGERALPSANPGDEPAGSRASVVVDIPAIAREQLHADAVRPAEQVRVQVAAANGIPPALAAVLSLVVVTLLSGTGAFVALAFRRKSSTPIPVPAAPPQPPAASGLMDLPELAASSSSILLDDPGVDDESHFAHETSLQLARTFRRGSEEITLARRLHDRIAPQWSAARMDETLGRATTPNQRLHFARKLGVGRGEMELAAKLRTMRPVDKQEGVGS